MLRVLVLVLLLLLVWRATVLLLERARLDGERRVRGSGRGPAAGGEELVRCAACGTRVPASRAVGDAGRYCSEACRRRAAGGAA